MTTSMPFPLGSPSFIEQQWKSRPSKENSKKETPNAAVKRVFAETANSLNGNSAATFSPQKTPDRRIPSIIATLSPKKVLVGRIRKKACLASPDNFAASATPQTAAWNTFIPLHFCSRPFELPHDQIHSMIAQIQTEKMLPPLLAQGKMLDTIVECAHIVPAHSLVHYKKQTPLLHPADAEAPADGLAGSFFVASLADKIYIMVSSRKVLARGSLGQVTEAVGLVFKRNGPKIEFEGHFEAVKHSVALQDSEHDSLDGVLKRVKSRIQAATDLAGVPHVANPYFHGVLQGVKGRKMIMMYPRFDGDLLSYHGKNVLTDEQRKSNVLKVAEHLSAALEGIHSQNYVHRDVKEENLLVNWTLEKLLDKVALADFDLSTKVIGNTLCGTLQYLAPEMMANVFQDESIAKALEVEDLYSLFGPALDTWGLGLILHRTLYNTLPDHVYHLIEYLGYTEDIRASDKSTPPAHRDALLQLAEEAKGKWIASMLEAIEKEKTILPPAETTWENFVQSLLFIDPRKRPNDAAIRKAVTSLKSGALPT